jgi:hypothetical protein
MPEPSLFGIGKAQWEIINSFANWLAAIGTIAAVIVSLYLANRSMHKARLSVGLRILVGPGSTKPYPQYVVFNIVNVGERPLRITNIGWRTGLWKKRHALQLFEESMSSKLPVDLTQGETAQWFVPTTAPDEPWSSYFARGFLSQHPRIALRTLRGQAFSSLGHIFEAEPEPDLISKLREACAVVTAKGLTPGGGRIKSSSG